MSDDELETLLELQKQLGAALPMAANGHEIGIDGVAGLRCEGDWLIADLYHRVRVGEDDVSYQASIVVLSAAVLADPDQARMRLGVYLDMLREVLGCRH